MFLSAAGTFALVKAGAAFAVKATGAYKALLRFHQAAPAEAAASLRRRAYALLARRFAASMLFVQFMAPQIPTAAATSETVPCKNICTFEIFPRSLIPAVPIREAIPMTAASLKIKLKTYVLSISLRPFLFQMGVYRTCVRLSDLYYTRFFLKINSFFKKYEQPFAFFNLARLI